jgi:hypothetical protein
MPFGQVDYDNFCVFTNKLGSGNCSLWLTAMLTRAPRQCLKSLRVLSLSFSRAPITSGLIQTILPASATALRPKINRFNSTLSSKDSGSFDEDTEPEENRKEHAVISTFDLFSIGVGPSS